MDVIKSSEIQEWERNENEWVKQRTYQSFWNTYSQVKRILFRLVAKILIFSPDNIEVNVNLQHECYITKTEKWLTLIWLAVTPVRDETHLMFVLHSSPNVVNADNSSISFILNGVIFT